jgi:hypothetical protein
MPGQELVGSEAGQEQAAPPMGTPRAVEADTAAAGAAKTRPGVVQEEVQV